MSGFKPQGDLPFAETLDMRGEFADATEVIWQGQELDDSRLRNPDVQKSFAHACSVKFGPAWSKFMASVHSTLAAPPYWAVLRLQHQRPAPALLAAVAVSLGTLCDPYVTSWSKVLQEIATKQKWTPDLEWHTDSTGWPSPNRLTALSCVQPAPDGGATELLSLNTFRTVLAGNDAQSLHILESALFPWPLDADLGGGFEHDLILAEHRVRFMRAALLESDDDELRRAVQRMVQVIDAIPADDSVLLAPGDILIFDNRRTFHRRGEITDPERLRLLVRTKIS